MLMLLYFLNPVERQLQGCSEIIVRKGHCLGGIPERLEEICGQMWPAALLCSGDRCCAALAIGVEFNRETETPPDFARYSTRSENRRIGSDYFIKCWLESLFSIKPLPKDPILIHDDRIATAGEVKCDCSIPRLVVVTPLR